MWESFTVGDLVRVVSGETVAKRGPQFCLQMWVLQLVYVYQLLFAWKGGLCA